MYAKIINEETQECEVGLGTNSEFYQKIGMSEMEVEKAYNGNWYVKGFAPVEPQDEIIKKQINDLEAQITDRNIRGAILGDEFALNKITDIENQIAELRKQLGV